MWCNCGTRVPGQKSVGHDNCVPYTSLFIIVLEIITHEMFCSVNFKIGFKRWIVSGLSLTRPPMKVIRNLVAIRRLFFELFEFLSFYEFEIEYDFKILKDITAIFCLREYKLDRLN